MNQRSEDESIAGLEIGPTTPIESLPEYLTAEEIARHLRVGKSSIYELIKIEKLPAVTIGRCRRVSKRDYVDFLNNGK